MLPRLFCIFFIRWWENLGKGAGGGLVADGNTADIDGVGQLAVMVLVDVGVASTHVAVAHAGLQAHAGLVVGAGVDGLENGEHFDLKKKNQSQKKGCRRSQKPDFRGTTGSRQNKRLEGGAHFFGNRKL